ncbi:MAG: alpha/beta fold hydrolase [Alphaproteobacteria bacterium]
MDGTGFRERRIGSRDGLSLYVRDYGDPLAGGVPLLCLAGLTRNAKDFHTLASREAGQRRILCPDYRGRGESPYDPDWRNYRPEVILDDIFQVLTACNAHPVVICGVSYGGLMAMALGALSPTMLVGVILNDVGPDLDPEGSGRIMDYIGRDRPQPDWPTAIAEMKRALPTLALADDDAWRRFTEATYRPGADGQLHFDWDVSLAKVLRQSKDTPDLWPLYRTLQNVPVLALRGGLSDILSEQTFARMATEKPDLLQLTVPGVGHVPSFEHPLVEHAIDDFLARIDA